MNETKPRTLAAVVVACLIGAALYAGSRLTTDDPDDRVVTLAAAWSDRQISARIEWFATSRGNTDIIWPPNHWEHLFVARKGDLVWLKITPANGTASCSIAAHGAAPVNGANYCQIKVLP